MRLRLTVSYDGSAFAGWQSQRGGGTVQDALEDAFHSIAGRRIPVHGAGRTDAGVHATGQCAHADVPDGMLPCTRWCPALNAHLPPAVRVMNVREAAPDFHARFSAVGKIYRYSIWNAGIQPPLMRDRTWHVPHRIDRNLLASVCAGFKGRHDFAAFSARRADEGKSTVRELTSAGVSTRGAAITLTFRGEGFLYKMVRMLTAAAVRCAMGRADREEILSRLTSAGPRWNHVAPACGLCLVRVVYPPAGRVRISDRVS